MPGWGRYLINNFKTRLPVGVTKSQTYVLNQPHSPLVFTKFFTATCLSCCEPSSGLLYTFYRKRKFFLWRCGPTRAMASSFLRFLDHTKRRIKIDRTPLDEWSARRRGFYLTTRNTHDRQTSMAPVGFEPTISGGERPQTYALDRAATGTGKRKSRRPDDGS